MKMEKLSVALAGPPPVSKKMASKIFIASMKRITSAMMMIGVSMGSIR